MGHSLVWWALKINAEKGFIKMKRVLCLAMMSFSLTLLSSCSAGSPSNMVTPPPVQAQTSYSNTSLSGTYSFALFDSGGVLMIQGSSSPFDVIGSLQFNGTGNITGASLTVGGAGSTCTYSGTGTYSVQSTALGTATLSVNQTSTVNACQNSGTFNFNIAVAQQGNSVQFTSGTPGVPVYGSAVKQ